MSAAPGTPPIRDRAAAGPLRVLIAGCGYVGRALAQRLLDDGSTVFALRRSPGGLEPLAGREGELHLLSADVTDPNSLEGLPPDLDSVVYSVSAGDRSDGAYRRAYVEGPGNLLQALSDAGSGSRRFLFTSSTGVYGQETGEWVDEETPAEPRGFSGRRLLEGERLVRARHPGSIVVRFAGIYGPDRTRLIDRVRAGEARCTEGDSIWTNRIHRDDCAGALHHLLSLEDPRDLYLGVDDEPADRCQVYRWIARRLGVPLPPRVSRLPNEGRRRSNKRCRNARLRESGYSLLYRTYREGYGSILG